ncbi:MAG: DUF2059 domain-containing protein [Paracoccaceae bacterium]
MTQTFRSLWTGLGLVVLMVLLLGQGLVGPARAADRDKLAAFLSVTGFDVALDSLRLSASSAPMMLGLDPGVFGVQWTRLADRVFETDGMRDMALDILSETLSDELLAHAAGYYASDLGQRLVEAENAGHMMEDDGRKQEDGAMLIAAMVEAGSPRLATIQRMIRAIDTTGNSARALQEVQFRFLMAASAAAVIDLKMDADELRSFLKSREGEVRRSIQKSALASAAYTYQSFSDEELLAYTEALEDPQMQEVYQLMNAIQFEIMANRFEVLAAEMAKLQPGQEL